MLFFMVFISIHACKDGHHSSRDELLAAVVPYENIRRFSNPQGPELCFHTYLERVKSTYMAAAHLLSRFVLRWTDDVETHGGDDYFLLLVFRMI
jgi:hypothetical protein